MSKDNINITINGKQVAKKKIKLSDKSIEGMPELLKGPALDWYRDLPRSKTNELLDKYEIASPLTNGCVLKIYQAENN